MPSWLSRKEARDYAYLTTRMLSTTLEYIVLPGGGRHLATNELMAAGMMFAGLPAALAVVEIGKDYSIGLLSIAVAKDFRRLGIAKELIEWIKREAKELGFSPLWTSYPLDQSCTMAMKRLTADNRGWRHRQGLRVVCLDRLGIKRLDRRLSSVKRRLLQSGQFEVRSWNEITPSILHKLNSAAARMTEWSIASTENNVLERNEVNLTQVLLYQDLVIGWLILHKIDNCSVRVTQWWISSEWQGRGIALLLIAQATHAALHAKPRIESASFGVAVGNHEMELLCKRLLEPMACNVRNMERAILDLRDMKAHEKAD